MEYQSIHKCARCGGNVSEAEDHEAAADDNYMPYCESCAEDGDYPNEIVAAQLIEPYEAPGYLIKPIGELSDEDDLAAINDDFEIVERTVQGWGEYKMIILAGGNVYYLAKGI